MSSVSLTAQMTSNLLSLQGTAKLMGLTQERLATGKKVNSSVDDPVAYFDADAHYQLANDYATFKNGMSEAVQTIKAATDTIDSIKNILNQMKSVANSAKIATTVTEVTDYQNQFNTLIAQLNNLQGDAGYKGVNLLASVNNQLDVVFNTEGDKLTVSGFNANNSGLAVATAATWAGSGASIDAGAMSTTIGTIDTAITTLRTKAKAMATNLGIVTERQSFTDKMIATLKIGGDNLTLADMNEEGANMLMLQTRQALGIQSLSMASQSAQQVLQLFQ